MMLLLIACLIGMSRIDREEWAGQEEIGCAALASTRISKGGMLANIVDTQSMEALTHQPMSWQDQGTGTAPPWIVVLTTMPVDQTAIFVVHIKLIILVWQMPVSHLDGNLVTGFAIGEFTLITTCFQQIIITNCTQISKALSANHCTTCSPTLLINQHCCTMKKCRMCSTNICALWSMGQIGLWSA